MTEEEVDQLRAECSYYQSLAGLYKQLVTAMGSHNLFAQSQVAEQIETLNKMPGNERHADKLRRYMSIKQEINHTLDKAAIHIRHFVEETLNG